MVESIIDEGPHLRIPVIMLGAILIVIGLLLTFAYPVRAYDRTLASTETITHGTATAGTFPESTYFSDDDKRTIQAVDDGGVHYIDVAYGFQVVAQPKNALFVEVSSDWSILMTCSPCFEFSAWNGNQWRALDNVYWTSDEQHLYQLTGQEAGQSPVKIRVYNQDVGGTSFIYIDQMYIRSWEEVDPTIIDPPDDDEEDEDDGETGDGDEKGLIIIGPVMIGTGVGIALYGVDGRKGAVIIGLIIFGLTFVAANFPAVFAGG